MKKLLDKYFWLIVFLICITSRLFTTIFYLEDPDSLRFAYSIKDFDLTILQPHFPGYAVYCFLVKLIYLFTNNVAYSFSIIGGVSTFFLVLFTIKCCAALGLNINRYILSLLILINPFLWLLGNRFMPDLCGLALLMASIFFLIKAFESASVKSMFVFYFLLGLLAGVRLSFIPFLLIPSLWLFFIKKNRLLQIIACITGVLIWFIPLLIDTGWSSLINVAKLQSDGHFNEWGETVITKSLYGLRFTKIIETIWADGLGCFLINRSYLTIIVSLGYLFGGLFGLKKVLEIEMRSIYREVLLIIGCGLVAYFVWIFFYQNVIYKARHIIPFIPFVLIIVSIGWSYFIKSKNRVGKLLFISFFVSISFVTIKLTQQHQEKTAIAQLSEFVLEKEDEKVLVYTTELMHEYLLRSGNVNPKYIEYDMNVNIELLDYTGKGYKLFSTQNIDIFIGKQHSKVIRFYHNPYVNRSWSEITLYEYEGI